MAEIYSTMSGNECNVSYVVLHALDLRYGREIDIHIHCTAPYSAAHETTTSVGLAHARPINGIAQTCFSGRAKGKSFF